MPPSLEFHDEYGTKVRATPWSGSERRRAVRFAVDVAIQLVVRRRSYQVVHWNMPGLQALAGIPVARALAKVNVMMFAGSGEAKSLQRSQRGRWLLYLLRRFADAIIVLNPEMRTELEALGFGVDRVHWFPCEISADPPPDDCRRAELRGLHGLPSDALVVVFTGRYVEAKRLPDLVEAFASVIRAVPSALLVLVGDGPERGRLEAQAAKLGIGDAVRFTGFLPEQQVRETLYAGDLFAMVSWIEGIPCSLVEAMAAGLPCVVSDIPAMTQLVRQGKHGRVVAVGDVKGIANAIIELLRNPQTRSECGRSARLHVVPEFTIETVAARYRKLYEHLLAKRAGAV
jgi:glycosyltransferase involved in cell wall biosynthesis